jgi:hypothetical protein
MRRATIVFVLAPKGDLWSRQATGWIRALRQCDLVKEISQTCEPKRHRKAELDLEQESGDRRKANVYSAWFSTLENEEKEMEAKRYMGIDPHRNYFTA